MPSIVEGYSKKNKTLPTDDSAYKMIYILIHYEDWKKERKKESNSIMNSIGENKNDRSSSSKLISTIKNI
ncbi:hypothetical protein AXW59_12440 [Yersinia ruckeri]|nr:hypothetical protein AXW59_12440 [Yersinia ruckeri]OJC00526.1 hypothetical protein AXW58_12415 [Yersinia ruckeri]OJC03394.1 hypothetical protein AXW57_12435 [Yersinia ruckeri]